MASYQIYRLVLIYFLFSIGSRAQAVRNIQNDLIDQKVFLVVLGTGHDAGSPHIACKKECCTSLFEKQDQSRKVVSLGLVDQINFSKYLFEATPDLPSQMKALKITSAAMS